MRLTSLVLPSLVTLPLALVACGGDDGGEGGSGLTCASVPACHTAAVAAVRACVPAPTLTLVPDAPMSGVIDGLACTGTDVRVAFSPFSASPTGTVPLPSSVTLTTSGAPCAELSSGTGTITDGSGASRSYTLSTITLPDGGEVEVSRFADGSLTVSCGAGTEATARAGALDSCPDAVVTHEVTRNADVTQIGVDLIDAAGARAALFACQ